MQNPPFLENEQSTLYRDRRSRYTFMNSSLNRCHPTLIRISLVRLVARRHHQPKGIYAGLVSHRRKYFLNLSEILFTGHISGQIQFIDGRIPFASKYVAHASSGDASRTNRQTPSALALSVD
jgi:hypothetical protein